MLRHGVRDKIFQALSPFFGGGVWVRGQDVMEVAQDVWMVYSALVQLMALQKLAARLAYRYPVHMYIEDKATCYQLLWTMAAT